MRCRRQFAAGRVPNAAAALGCRRWGPVASGIKNRSASSAAVECDLDRGESGVQARIDLSLRGAFSGIRRTRTLATRGVVCRANRVGRFRVLFAEPARSGGAGDRLPPRLDRPWRSDLQRFQGFQGFQGFRPALRAEQGAQAGTDFVFQTRFEPIETYTVNARLPRPPKHSDTHEALKSRPSDVRAIAIPTASESAIPCTQQIGGLDCRTVILVASARALWDSVAVSTLQLRLPCLWPSPVG